MSTNLAKYGALPNLGGRECTSPAALQRHQKQVRFALETLREGLAVLCDACVIMAGQIVFVVVVVVVLLYYVFLWGDCFWLVFSCSSYLSIGDKC